MYGKKLLNGRDITYCRVLEAHYRVLESHYCVLEAHYRAYYRVFEAYWRDLIRQIDYAVLQLKVSRPRLLCPAILTVLTVLSMPPLPPRSPQPRNRNRLSRAVHASIFLSFPVPSACLTYDFLLPRTQWVMCCFHASISRHLSPRHITRTQHSTLRYPTAPPPPLHPLPSSPGRWLCV